MPTLFERTPGYYDGLPPPESIEVQSREEVESAGFVADYRCPDFVKTFGKGDFLRFVVLKDGPPSLPYRLFATYDQGPDRKPFGFWIASLSENTDFPVLGTGDAPAYQRPAV